MLCLFLASCSDDDDTRINEINKQKLLEIVNSYRAKKCNCGSNELGPVPPVKWNANLERAAKQHTDYMNKTGNFSHFWADGTTPGQRIYKNNYDYSFCGENIASGNFTEERVVQEWMNSPSHCEKIMNGNYKEMGIAKTGNYWAQEFGAPR